MPARSAMPGGAENSSRRFLRQPIRYIILTQSHANQYGGLEIYKTADNTVIAHRNYPAERTYSEMLERALSRGARAAFLAA